MNGRKEGLPFSYTGSKILGETFDLLGIDLERDHPEPDLICIALVDPDDLVSRTNQEVATSLIKRVLLHLEDCEECCTFARENVKFY